MLLFIRFRNQNDDIVIVFDVVKVTTMTKPPSIHQSSVENDRLSSRDINRALSYEEINRPSPTNVYIAGLSVSSKRQDIFTLFNEYSFVSSLTIDSIPSSISVASTVALPERYAIACIATRGYAEQTVQNFNGHLYMGRHLYVSQSMDDMLSWLQSRDRDSDCTQLMSFRYPCGSGAKDYLVSNPIEVILHRVFLAYGVLSDVRVLHYEKVSKLYCIPILAD